jgi:hypothetical protein
MSDAARAAIDGAPPSPHGVHDVEGGACADPPAILASAALRARHRRPWPGPSRCTLRFAAARKEPSTSWDALGSRGLAATLGVTRWEDVRISMVDMQTVSIEANGTKLLRTFVELGFVDGRKRESVSPTKAWSLLLLFCKQQRIKPSEYREFGKPYGVKKSIQSIGVAMRAAFGLDDHPIHSYSKRNSLWEARFRVEEPAPEGERGQKRGRKG